MEHITAFTPSTLVYKRDDDMPTISSSSESVSTPPISVPPNDNNPYIIREVNPNGTVFIAFGAIVGAMLIAFVLFYLIKSIKASSLAKKSLAGDKKIFEKYQSNNNTAYGITPTSTNNLNMNSEYQLSVAKLPLLSQHQTSNMGGGSQVGDTSTIYASETGHATSKHDLTKMFISPTAEVMTHKRVRSSHYGGGSTSNLSLLGGSTSNLANPTPATNRHSQLYPSLYINNDTNNSEYSLNAASQPQNAPTSPSNQGLAVPRSNRKTIPSMYLDDLIDDDKH